MPLLSIQHSWDSSETDCRTVASEWVASISETNRHTIHSLTATKATDGNIEASLLRPPSRRSRWLRIRLNAVASCTTVSHCQCASVVWAFPACDWTNLGVLPPASFRDRGASSVNKSGATAGRRTHSRPSRQPPSILLAGLMGVCVPCPSFLVCSSANSVVDRCLLVAGPKSQTPKVRSEWRRSSTGLTLCRGLASSPSDLSVPCRSDSPLDAG